MKLTAMEKTALRLVTRHQGFTAPELAQIGRCKKTLELATALIALVDKELLVRGENRQCGVKRMIFPTYRTAEPSETSGR